MFLLCEVIFFLFCFSFFLATGYNSIFNLMFICKVVLLFVYLKARESVKLKLLGCKYMTWIWHKFLDSISFKFLSWHKIFLFSNFLFKKTFIIIFLYCTLLQVRCMFDPFSPLLFASFIFLVASRCHLKVTEIHMIVLFCLPYYLWWVMSYKCDHGNCPMD